MKSNKSKKSSSKKNFDRDLAVTSTRIKQLSELIEQITQWQYPADAVLSHWFRNNPKAGPKDRAELAQAAYNVLRNLRRFRQFAQSGQGPNARRLAILGLSSLWPSDKLAKGIDSYEQAWLKHVAGFNTNDLPLAVHYSIPDWLLEKLSNIDNLESLLAALNKPAPLDLRVNTFKAERNKILEKVSDLLGKDTKSLATPYSPWGIRIFGNPAINRWDLFKNGEIEVQDEGSQLLAALLAPKRGELVIDFCAGAGGKTLLLGAIMKSTGRLYAFDVSAARLARAKQRIARSGLSNVVSVVINSANDQRVKRLRQKADRVLIDAPCSGLGTLRRNPDIKWRQQASDIEQLCATQAEILSQAAACLKPGGRLVYATCSILAEENEHQVTNFLAKNTDFKLLNASEVLAKRDIDLNFQDEYLRLRPDLHNTDGFFAAVLQKS